jgi:hypothetical protein
VVTRLLERLPRWQLALISMAAGAGLFADSLLFSLISKTSLYHATSAAILG